eukprot:jgi/Botrbrau1/17530/Bobra.0529s0002.1
MLTRAPAKLSIAFADPDVEKAYLKLVRENRKSGDTLAFTICTIVYIKFYVCGVFEGPAAILLWFCSTLILACLVSFSIGLISRHPYVLQWKPFLMPPLGICGNIALKLMAPLSYRSLKFDGSLLRGIPVIATISRATHCFVALGLWSTTGSTFFTDLALMASLQVTNFTWNKDECELLCGMHPNIRDWAIALDSSLSQLMLKNTATPNPIRGCICMRVFMQVTIGGILPIVLAYKRELRERAAFLKAYKITILQPVLSDYFLDLLLICSILVMSVGGMTAMFLAAPELLDLPMMLA